MAVADSLICDAKKDVSLVGCQRPDGVSLCQVSRVSGNDQAVPVGAEAAGDVERLDPTILLSAMAVAVDGLGAVGGRVDGTDRFDPVVQGLLVGFDLGDEKASCILGRFKGFFDSASHRR